MTDNVITVMSVLIALGTFIWGVTSYQNQMNAPVIFGVHETL
jgi:hypothetical protein